MNFLFGALLLILLLFPGVAFRIGYLSVPFNSKSFKSSFLEELLFSLIPAFIFQVLGYALVEAVWKNVDEQALYLILINSADASKHQLALSSIVPFSFYLVVLNLIALFTGVGVRHMSLRYGWHLNYPFLRIYNEWQIYFEGIILDREDKIGSSKNVREVWVDALVESKEESYLYSGFLKDYVVDKDEKLDRIYLAGVRRRKLKDDLKSLPEIKKDDNELDEVNYSEEETFNKEEIAAEETIDDRYYFMPGEYFMIPAAHIRNLNIIYYSAEIETLE